MGQVDLHPRLTQQEMQNFAIAWYAALDRHDPIEQVISFLDDDSLVMKFPEGTFHGLSGFRHWYETVIHRFFDEEHSVRSVEVASDGAGLVQVEVVVNWQARVWDPPAARSTWLGFDATQTWTVGAAQGRPKIREYAVVDLHPMPGSATL